MKRTLTLALSAVLGGGFVVSAFAQDNFPDAPENHWAFEALANMKKAGLLVGYPDGLFRGGRPASRYELAVAIHATYQHLKNLADGMEGRIKALEDKIGNQGGTDTSGLASKADLQAVRDALAALQSQVNGMKGWGDDIAALKKMASTFERELASLGVDVEAMKKGLNDLANRVTALEKRKPAVDIHGTMNLLALGGYSDDNRFGITKEGRPTGVHRDTGNPTGIGHDINIWHEGDITLTTTNDTGPKARATIGFGNTMAEADAFGFSRQAFLPSGLQSGVAFGDENEADIWFQEFEVSFDTTVWGQDLKARAGRIGKKTGAYFFQRPDTTLDYKNEYWDNGLWYFDGVDFSLGFGSVDLSIFGGRQSARFTSDGTDPWLMTAGNFGNAFEPGGFTGNNPSRPRGFTANNGIIVDNELGLTLNVPVLAKGHLNLQYLMLDSDTTSTVSASPVIGVNRVNIFGGELKFPIGGNLALTAGYSQTNLMNNDSTVVDEDNAAWWVRGEWNASDKWGLYGGYRQIDPQFYAPGDWGRIGIWWNPNDIKGFNVGGWLHISDRTAINASAEFDSGADNGVNGGLGLTEDDKVTSFKIKLSHKINDSWTAQVGGEWVNWDVNDRASSKFVGGKPTEKWFDLGFKYAFNENTWWSIMWQTSDYDGKGVVGFNPFAFSGSDRATGGKITSQLSVKY
jgi:hypothetical protein